jgi:hypothetical protein
MLSQDNFSSGSRRPRKSPRTGTRLIWLITLASLGLLASTTQMQWQIPSLEGYDAAPIVTASVSTKSSRTTPVTALKPPALPVKRTVDTAPVEEDFQSAKAISSLPTRSNAIALRPIKQPGDNIIIKRLSYAYSVPVSSDGLPEFYKVVLEPKGTMTELGLTQRKARANFGYDQQDIFTGEVPDGAYVLHCQRSGTSSIRAMCWRELQVSDDQWVQYRFPRAQLKDWWKIERKVRANIG